MASATARPMLAATGLQPRERRPGDASLGAAIAKTLGRASLLGGILLLAFQWQMRNEGYLTAETGLGYYFGIAGVSAMLLLLSYSARKRFRFLRRLGAIQGWFRVHMTLGLLGPALIIAHSNFKLGSTNSSVALASMLLVAGSGIIGRFIYTRIHFGLYGARADIERLGKEVDRLRGELGPAFDASSALRESLEAFEAASLAPSRTVFHAIWRVMAMGVRTRRTGLRARALVARALADKARGAGERRSSTAEQLRLARTHIDEYLRFVRKAAELSFWERVFALWHVLHIPLFFMMVLAAAVHVLAVHTY